jgi:hypothetical protein
MAAKLTRLTQKIAIQLHLVAESCTICSSRSMRPVRKLLDTPSYDIQYYNAQISTRNSKAMAVYVKQPTKCKIVTNDQTARHAKSFTFPLTHLREEDPHCKTTLFNYV